MPDLVPFAAHLAARFGPRRLRVLAEGHEPRDFTIGRHEAVTAATPGPDARHSGVVAVFGSLADERDMAAMLALVEPHLGVAPVAVLAGAPRTDGRSPEALAEALRARGVSVLFTGLTRDRAGGAERSTPLVVIGGTYRPDLTLRAPAGYRVVAFVSAHNEEDIVEASLERLARDGIEVRFFDNWSTDRTYKLAERHLGRGVASLERFPPEGPDDQFRAHRWLEHVERRSRELGADWFIKHDVDEIRVSPWPELSLRDALHLVAADGFEAIDFSVVNFHPVDEGHRPGESFERHFRHFDFGPYNGPLKQVKAWRATQRALDLAATGGHRALPVDARVYPFKFLLKHYRFRSREHAERKVRERLDRFREEAAERGWHGHYRYLAEQRLFVRRPVDLTVFEADTFPARYLTERLAGVPRVEPRPVPALETSPAGPLA